jgi:hypothetical protein
MEGTKRTSYIGHSVLTVAAVGLLLLAVYTQAGRKFDAHIARIEAERRKEREEVIERIAGLEGRLEALSGMVEKETGEIKSASQGLTTIEERILMVLTEKVTYDYTRRGLEHFKGGEYLLAHETFSRALRYQRSNTTLLFYQTYSLYLSRVDQALTSGEWETILANVRELDLRGYRPQERLDFTGEQMRQKASDMAYNIGELQKRSTGETS